TVMGKPTLKATADYKVAVWDVATGNELLTLEGAFDGQVVLSRDGGRVAAQVYRGPQRSPIAATAVKVWDVATRQELAVIELERYAVSITFSPDGTRLAAIVYSRGKGALDSSVWLWDAATGKTVQTIRPRNLVANVRFSPDGMRLAAGGTSGLSK